MSTLKSKLCEDTHERFEKLSVCEPLGQAKCVRGVQRMKRIGAHRLPRGGFTAFHGRGPEPQAAKYVITKATLYDTSTAFFSTKPG